LKKSILFLFFILISRTLPTRPRIVFYGRVNRVYDGDTILVSSRILGKIKVRFLGVDTPESYYRRFGFQEYLGKKASFFVRRLLLHKTVRLVSPRKNNSPLRDRYGRILAFIELNRNDICALLLKKGLARVYRKSPSSRHRFYLKLEHRAKKRRIGIWNFKRSRRYYRRQYERTGNDRIILWFWRFDKGYLKRLLMDD